MANHDLIKPLLPSDQTQLIITVENESPDPQSNTIYLEIENPFEFIGSRGFSLPGSTTVDPFRNDTPRIEGVYEWVKILVCLPIALVRLVLFGLCLAVGYVATKIALYAWKDKENPMPKWRCRLMWVTRICTRCILFSFG